MRACMNPRVYIFRFLFCTSHLVISLISTKLFLLCMYVIAFLAISLWQRIVCGDYVLSVYGCTSNETEIMAHNNKCLKLNFHKLTCHVNIGSLRV